ncbi:PREDICTED: protein transport protein Sec24C [Cyphomyrmex costatus]|uniref:protein transport protein Sec24C n=1 Tax=Cyphomyrmex costatus TaxID=456900 RepID=UPI00085240CA|nr:PREDICTED: protein transport protein Sec24C [Cyphomyrmex costatus]
MQHIPDVGRQHPYAESVPPIKNQQNFIKPPIAGEQNLSNSQMHSSLLSMPPGDRSQIMSPPMTGIPGSQIPSRVPIGSPLGHGQASVGYQAQGTNLLNASLHQSGAAPYNSVPPLPPLLPQVRAPPTDPGSDPSQFTPLSTTGQSIISSPGSNFSQARQKQYLPTMPPMADQTTANTVGPNVIQPGQRQYGSTMPPLPGQNLSSPLGMNCAPPGTTLGYQQPAYQQPTYQQPTYQQPTYQQPGYPNQMQDMYNNQRSPYQSTPNATGYQSGLQSQHSRRLDPDQMPSPIQVILDDRNAKSGVFITNQKGLVPPLVTTNFVTQDQGNASPRYIRSTMYTVPTSADIVKQTNIPLGLVISPMARIVQGEFEPPIVDMGEIGPVRCIRCKAYMCPFMQFIDAGRRFQCMFCKATTEVPNEYFQHLDHTGQRLDRYERPELMLGTFEYIATKDYCRDNIFPKSPAIVFIIDVSYNTVKSGLVNLLCTKMKSIIKNLPIDDGQTKSNMKVGFITYNNTVHFYNINPCLAQPQMMVVGDIQDVFMPLLDGFLCDIEESEAVIDSLMTQIPQMFADTRETETILAPAIQAGLEALKASECAGKLLIFHSSLPIAEAPGKLKNRDDRKVLGTDKEKTVLVPQNNVYNNLGQECVGAGCSVDLFIFNNSYVDLATIGQICRLTGGEIYKYSYFQADIDGERLITDIINNISRPIAFDAVMRVRTSTGIRATDFYGHYFMSNTTDMELGSIDCDKAIGVEIKHDDKLTEEEGVYIQVALLYTSCSGIRRLRIINLSLKTSMQMVELYRTCDSDAILNYVFKQNVFKLLDSTPKTVKDNLIARCANILATYRKNCTTPSSAGQLILPECMKLLPLYLNCLLKNDALSGGADMTIDDKSYVMQAVVTMPIPISVAYIYPRLYPLHDVDLQDTELPPLLRCSIDKFTEDGAYLLENTIHMFLWLGMALSSEWVQNVFGVPSVIQVDTDRPLPILDTPLNNRIMNIIKRIRAERHHCLKLTIVRQREKLEMVLRHFLVEDRGNDGSPSYVDFLCHMHKEIRTLLSTQ